MQINHNEVPVHIYYDGSNKKKAKQKISVGKLIEKLEPLCIVSANKKGLAAMDNSFMVPQRVKHRVTT